MLNELYGNGFERDESKLSAKLILHIGYVEIFVCIQSYTHKHNNSFFW